MKTLFGLDNGAIGMPRRNSIMSFINPMVTGNSLTEEGSRQEFFPALPKEAGMTAPEN
jgi:hypothetical protein